MLSIMFKRIKILYPALEDFDVDIEKIVDVNDLWHFKNKFNDSIELIIKATKNWKDEKVIEYLEITKDNKRYSYKNMPFLICLNTYSNKIIEEFFMKKNNVIQINSYKIMCTQTLNKFKKILIRKITINNKDSDNIIVKNGNFVGDVDNVYLKEYENHKIRQVTRCYNGKKGHPTKPGKTIFKNGRIYKEIYINPSTGLVDKKDGPAIITYNKIGKIQSRGYYINGNKVTDELELAILKSYNK